MSFVGGKLKLKGVSDLPGVKKKKKKSKQVSDIKDTSEPPAITDDAGAGTSTQEAAPPAVEDRRTEAEKKYEAHLLKTEEQRLKKAASKSHRERVKELNEKLANTTEHFDLPRISHTI